MRKHMNDIIDSAIQSLNAHDVDGLTSLCAPDVYFYNPSWPESHDLSLLRAFLLDIWAGFRDLQYEVTNRIESRASCVLECTAAGRNSGTIRHRPPTGRRAEWPLVFIVNVDDGTITAWKTHLDRLGLWQQLGDL